MTQLKAFAPNVEVNGETVLSILDGMGIFKHEGIRILADNNIPNPQPGQWFKQQDWLNAFKTIAEKVGPKTLRAIGRKIPENAQWPPQVDTLEKALGSVDMAYHMNHRNGDIGFYKYESPGGNKGRMVCKNPYPCDFDRGIIESVCRKFKPPSVPRVKVTHDDAQPCRQKGADSCTYLIEW